MDHKAFDQLCYWMEERESIREKREQGLPPPWTEDETLSTYRFCNVYREDDRVTRWIAKNWRDPNKTHKGLPLAMCVARLVNWPDTLEELGYPEVWDSQLFMDVITSRKARGAKVWTGAYMVTGGYSKGGESKELIIARVLDTAAAHCEKIVKGLTLEGAAWHLAQVPGMGTFLGAQVVADLKYTPFLAGARDWFTWCAPGPGSMKGLNIVMGRIETIQIPEKQFRDEVNALRPKVKARTDLAVCAQDMQNCLCEFSKFHRAELGERLKTRFVEATEPLP